MARGDLWCPGPSHTTPVRPLCRGRSPGRGSGTRTRPPSGHHAAVTLSTHGSHPRDAPHAHSPVPKPSRPTPRTVRPEEGLARNSPAGAAAQAKATRPGAPCQALSLAHETPVLSLPGGSLPPTAPVGTPPPQGARGAAPGAGLGTSLPLSHPNSERRPQTGLDDEAHLRLPRPVRGGPGSPSGAPTGPRPGGSQPGAPAPSRPLPPLPPALSSVGPRRPRAGSRGPRESRNQTGPAWRRPAEPHRPPGPRAAWLTSWRARAGGTGPLPGARAAPARRTKPRLCAGR